MKILVVSQYFHPEEFKVNELVAEFQKRGHEVAVLTGKPNYPSGKIFEGYKFWDIQYEDYKGARVTRVPLIPRGNGNGLRLSLNYLSFVLFGGIYVKTHPADYDAIICFEISPVTQMYPALWAKRRKGCRTAIWVQDLWPESVAAAGKANNSFLHYLLNKMVKNIYRRSDVIFIQSTDFEKSILKKCNLGDKIVYAPNWADDYFVQPVVDKDKYRAIMPEGFKIMFAGNIGAAQDFDNIIEAANLTRGCQEIKWVIVGEGRYRRIAEEKVAKSGLKDTVFFLGRYPVSEMPRFFSQADVMLVSLKDTDIFSLTIPSKVQCYMACKKPILAMLSGIGSEIIKEARCGYTCNSGDYKSLAENAIKMYHLAESDLKEMSNHAYEYYNRNFRKDAIITKILENLQ